ncbi:hypothetical protein [Formosa algae]|uniref:Beta-carotene 15,15'-monooxygenase n=1 Tax=Formosa algae TaxID=225843 RepID=A0A9X0YPC2_9FLAO|nr:hypothetical protein [Formosa algae]MBP1841588.1 hypothetical protein [Formosa algae]MDQ0337019.1 hypothetical protein [Formosa algae]OEI80212.1 hypothetical protein AST99_10520 [Formosa algae]PNW27708.1 hypothetical protein BKP44_12105 [Formosa algae]
MDELDILKKDWNKPENQNFPKLSYNDLYIMHVKKSSSTVKWIFIISLLEFVFWTIISFGIKDNKAMARFKDTSAETILDTLSVMGYLVLFYFFYLFYKNYKKISTTDNAKKLMENILNTRRTVKQYVVFNLLFLVISTVVVLLIEFNQDPVLGARVNEAAASGHIFMFYSKVILITAGILTITITILLGFYYLIYGILLKRLNHNYKELKKMDL